MALRDYFSNTFETSDNASDKRLLTHYYNNELERAEDLVSIALKQNGYTLIHTDSHYHEKLFESKKVQIIVTLYRVGIYTTSVDIKINTAYILPFKRGIKEVDRIYSILDKKLTLKTKGGLHE